MEPPRNRDRRTVYCHQFCFVVWWVLSLGLQSPKPLQTLVLSVGDREHQDFLKIISKIAGVEDILLIKGEQLAYVQIDRLLIDMPSLQPYLNR